MASDTRLRRLQIWVGQLVMKTLFLFIGIFAVSALLGFGLFTWVQAEGAGPLSLAAEELDKSPRAEATPSFKVTIDKGTNLNGLFEPNETIFVPPQAKIDIWATGEGVAAEKFTASAEFAKTQSTQVLDVRSHAQFQINAESGTAFQLMYGNKYQLNVVVLYPAKHTVSKTGDITIRVDGTLLGTLRDAHKCGTKLVKEHVDCYVAPDYFVKITAENRNWPITAHCKIGQMVAPATRWVNNKKVFTDERHTDYFVPNRPLAEKLEQIALEMEKAHIRFAEWEVNSGYRTPAYNKSIGGATFSRHAWGDAIDIMIDCDSDHRMDDINKDGRSDRHDGILIAKIADKLEMDGKVAKGGVGVYQFDSDQSVGCHVHIDVRGYVVRWGQFGIGRSARSFVWWPESSYDPKNGGGE